MDTSQTLSEAPNHAQYIFEYYRGLEEGSMYEECHCPDCGAELISTSFFSKIECFNCGTLYEEDSNCYIEEFYA